MAIGKTRRDALRWLSGILGGAIISSPLIGYAAKGGGGGGNIGTCNSYCGMVARSKAERDNCLIACQQCNGDTSRICGPRGAMTCCPSSQTCIDQVCMCPSDTRLCGSSCCVVTRQAICQCNDDTDQTVCTDCSPGQECGACAIIPCESACATHGGLYTRFCSRADCRCVLSCV